MAAAIVEAATEGGSMVGDRRNPTAGVPGRKGGSREGKVQTASLTPEQRSVVAKKAAASGARIDRFRFSGYFIAMNTNSIPESASILQDLEPFFERVYPALEAAVDAAVKVFENERMPIDLGLHAYHTRVRAGKWLPPDVIGPTGFQKIEVGAGGLYFVSECYTLRLLKADHTYGEDCVDPQMALPTPHSNARSQYYDQPMFLGMGPAEFSLSPRIKLVGLWDIDKHYQLTEIGLALPKASATKRGESQHYWLVPVPYKAFGSSNGAQLPDPMPLDDLELPDRKEKTGTDIDVLGR